MFTKNVLKAVAELKHKPPHSWYLVRVLEEAKTPPHKKRVQSNLQAWDSLRPRGRPSQAAQVWLKFIKPTPPHAKLMP